MKVGTKSLLFGVHQFILHPVFVAIAWTKLYGFPFDPRLWVCFLVHDWGYWGLSELDGPEGDLHPRVGANIVHFLFDKFKFLYVETYHMAGQMQHGYEYNIIGCSYRAKKFLLVRRVKDWYKICLYHSRFLAKQDDMSPSRLCMADKLAACYYPIWLFLFLSNLSGEIKFFMNEESQKKHATMGLDYSTPYLFVKTMQEVLFKYAHEHKDGQKDTLT